MSTYLVSTGVQFPDSSIQTTAGGAVANGALIETAAIISADYTLSANKNALTVGPLTINAGVSLTVPSGYKLVIL
jgi:hypothetical protein